jgi:hypothetical protein
MLSKHVEIGWLVDIWIGLNALREHDNHAISMSQMHYDATHRPLSPSPIIGSPIHTYIRLGLNNALLMFYVELDANTSSFHTAHVATLRAATRLQLCKTRQHLQPLKDLNTRGSENKRRPSNLNWDSRLRSDLGRHIYIGNRP